MKNNEKKPLEFPMDIPGGYYARNYEEYKFDKMLRNHAKEQGKEAMYHFIETQNIRNSLRRIEEALINPGFIPPLDEQAMNYAADIQNVSDDEHNT